MLRTLHLRDFIIIDQAEISFDSGFTVFSGETGAGKSILIDALSLSLGARADSTLVREGSRRTDVTAVFEPNPAARQWLIAQALDDSELILRRVIDHQGRSKAYINGTPASLAQLREIGARLVDIHGQHAHQSLLQPASQREILDAQGQHTGLRDQVEAAWTDWQTAQSTLATARAETRLQTEHLAQLQTDTAYLDDIAPQADEWPELCARQSRLAHAQALLAGVQEAIERLDGEEGSAGQALSRATQALQALVRHDATMQALCETLESAHILCQEAVSELNAYRDRLELDPQALAAADARMSQLFDAARRFQVDPETLADLHDELRQKQQRLLEGQDLNALEQRCEHAQRHYQDRAEALSSARRAAAQKLSRQVTAAMQTLAMTGGVFMIELIPGRPSGHGLETVEFRVSGHAGVTPQPLAKVASGGELARIALALSVTASQAARVPTLIFDEVDAGVGGAVAEVVGRRLRELGEKHQVLCVTHLPQVAACAEHHFLVNKTTQAGRTASSIQPLTPAQRVEELSRMLGGMRITATTRRHATEMLQLLKH